MEEDRHGRVVIAVFTEADARELLETPDLIAVGVRADEDRRRRHGARTTFVRVFEIHVSAPPLTALPARTEAGELRIVGAPAGLDQAVACTRSVASIARGVAVTGFSLPDLLGLAEASGQSLADVCRALQAAGLSAVADVPLDHPDTTPEAIGIVRQAGLEATRLTVVEVSADARIALVTAARDLQEAAGGFRTFAPLPRAISVSEPTTGYDDLKLVALARLVAANIPSIQVDWALYGPKLAQVALTSGADDVDNVAAVEPGLLGQRRSALEEIRNNIKAAGLEPVERNARFEAVGT